MTGEAMFTRREILRPLGLAAFLAVGAGIVWAFALNIAQRCFQAFAPGTQMSERLQVGSDGKVLISAYYYAPYRMDVYRTLDGEEFRLPLVYGFLMGAELPGPRSPYAPTTPFAVAQRRMMACSDLRRPPTFWYFIHDGKPQGGGYFAGFHAESKRLVGYLGRAGFREEPPPDDERFPVDLRLVQNGAAFPGYEMWGREPRDLYVSREDLEGPNAGKVMMLSDGRLLEIDLRAGAVRTLLESPGLMAVNLVSRPKPPDAKPGAKPDAGQREPPKPQPLPAAVRSPDRVLVRDEPAGKWLTYPIPAEIRDLYFTFHILPGDQVLFIATRQFPDKSPREEILWVDAAGKVTRREEVVLASRLAPLPPKRRMWMAALTAPAPIAVAVQATVVEPLGSVRDGFAAGYPSALADWFAIGWLPFAAVCALSGALAWLTWRRQRTDVLPWTPVWVTFVLVGGVPAFLGYFFHRRRAVREPCPACNRRVPRDRDACTHCGAAFPAPAPKGIEVFAA